MLAVTVGAVVAMLTTFAINWQSQRDFAREWAESLRGKKGRNRLGEELLASRFADRNGCPRAARSPARAAEI